jgi:hypothetical protein
MSTNSILVGYSPNDFFYNTISSISVEDKQNDSDSNSSDLNCDNLKLRMGNVNCGYEGPDSVWGDSGTNLGRETCVQYEICTNKENVNWLATQSTPSATSLSDVEDIYNKTIIMTVNLAIGIVAIIYALS